MHSRFIKERVHTLLVVERSSISNYRRFLAEASSRSLKVITSGCELCPACATNILSSLSLSAVIWYSDLGSARCPFPMVSLCPCLSSMLRGSPDWLLFLPLNRWRNDDDPENQDRTLVGNTSTPAWMIGLIIGRLVVTTATKVSRTAQAPASWAPFLLS